MLDPIDDIAALKKPARSVYKVFLHCSASDNPQHDYPIVIDRWHRARGFSEIGYHFFISKDGTIWEGRSLEKIPAAQEGHNTGSIAICCHGLDKDNFTDAQRHALRGLCIVINRLYKGGLSFHGHCEVSSKACPVYDYRAWLALDESGRMQ